MELIVANNTIELKDIVSYYAPVFAIAFSQDCDHQNYIATSFAILQNRFDNFDDLNGTVFLLLDHCLQEAEKVDLLRNQFQDLKLIYQYLNKASDKLKDYIRYLSGSNEAITIELETIIDLLKRDQQPTAADLLKDIVTTYKEDSIQDFLSFQDVIYTDVLKQKKAISADLKVMFN